MTTIGTAVLQIIPSLRGVTEEIEKQLDGKVVEVKIAPKVDPAAAKKAGQDAGTTVAKSADDAAAKTPIQPKVDKPAAQKAGKDAGDAITKGAKDAVTKGDIGKTISEDVKTSVKKSSPGKDLAKVIVDGIATGAKQEMRDGSIAEVIVDGLAEGVKQGIDGEGIGGEVVDAIGSGVKRGNLGGTIKDAVLPTISQIGTEIKAGAAAWSGDIANSLRSGDIQGATDQIATTVRTTTDTIATIGETFGLQLGDVRSFGGDVANILSEAGGMGSAIINTVDQVKGISQAFGLMGPAAEKAAALTNTALSLIVIPEIGKEINDKIQDYLEENHPDAFRLNNTNTPDQLGPKARAWFDSQVFTNPDAKPTPVPVDQLPQTGSQSNETPTIGGIPIPGLLPRKSGGGRVSGPGTSISDSILALLSDGEYVVNAEDTRKNLTLLELVNSGKLPGFAGGGLVGPDQLRQFSSGIEGKPYVWGGVNWGDCSGAVSAIANFATGRAPFGSRFATATESAELAARGFKSGTGPAGSLSIGWYNGGRAGGHTAATLPDGTNVEMGGKRGNGQFGGGAAGANDPQFTSHAFLPPEFFTGLDGGAPTRGGGGASSPVSGGGGGSSISSAVMSTLPASGGGGGSSSSSSSSGGGGGTSLPTSISGLATAPFDALSRLGASRDGPGHRDPLKHFPQAASAAIGGQIDSALGVFGINGSPSWLTAASTLLGEISVGGHDPSGISDGSLFNGSNLFNFGGAGPLSANSTSGGTPPLDDPKGTRAEQQTGPQVVYNIRTATVEDAFLQAQRKQNERSKAKLSVY